MKYLLCITGASGSVYAERFLDELLKREPERIYIVASKAALQVLQYELGYSRKIFGEEYATDLRKIVKGELTDHQKKIIRLFDVENIFAPFASGSNCPDAMVVLPCSMGTMSRIRSGAASNLIERAADVMIKQKRPLIISPRETPLSEIHLENMLVLSRISSVMIIPTIPGFYNRPQQLSEIIDFSVARVFEGLAVPHTLYPKWNDKLS